MDILTNAIGFFIALPVSVMLTRKVFETLFMLIPFMRKKIQEKSELQAIEYSWKVKLLWVIVIIFSISIITGIFYIPIIGVTLGAALGVFSGVRYAFDTIRIIMRNSHATDA